MDYPIIIAKRPISVTRTLPRPNVYTKALDGEYSHRAFNEERAPMYKGKWREIFNQTENYPLDLEIGTGNGFHFAEYAKNNPNRLLLGIELKYKPLIQSIRRALNYTCQNAAMIRYHAFNISDLFAPNEINNIFIHFPDPWTTPNKPKNRVVNRDILQNIYVMQKPGSTIEFKTDSLEYFNWAIDEISHTKYQILEKSFDLHNEKSQSPRFLTGFEKIFVNKSVPIKSLKLLKES